MHRRIIDGVLEKLDTERAGYFMDVVAKIESDPRTERHPNDVYVLLKETMRLLPTYLPAPEFIDALFAFVEDNAATLERKMFDKAYIYDQSVIQPITNAFVTKIVDLTLQHYETGDIETGEPATMKFSWPYRVEDLIDPDDDDEDRAAQLAEELKNRPPYTGPERRKRK